MKLKLVKASQGLTWIRQGLITCKQQALGFVGLLGLSFMLATLLASLLGEIGLGLATCLAPTIWMGFMLATRRVLTGQTVTPTVFIEPFKSDARTRQSFIMLGGFYGLGMLLAMALAAALGPDSAQLDDIKSQAKDMGEVLTNPLVQQSLLLEMLLTLPLTLLFLHAPALIVWAHLPVAKALFFSVMASWRNLGAFVVFGAGWIAVLSIVALLAAALSALLPVPLLANILLMATSMGMAASFYASLYFAVIDCFEAPHEEPVAG